MRLAMIGGLMILAPLAGEAAPRLVADVNQQPEGIGADPDDLVAAGGRVFYRAYQPTTGHELWVSDGTAGGTKMVSDLRVGQVGSLPLKLCAVGNRVFFSADDGEHGTKLWSSGGEAIVMAGDIGFVPAQAVAAGGLLYFTNGPTAGSPSSFGWGLWRSDGTAVGTWLLNPLNLSSGGIFPYRSFGHSLLLTELGGRLFFANLERELWQCAGTLEETVKLADLGEGSRIVALAADQGRLWLTVDRGNDRELWSWSEGTTAKIATVPDGAMAADRLTARSGRVFFTAASSLWWSDGTTTRQVVDRRSGQPAPFPTEPAWRGDVLHFAADDGVAGPGLWASDGNEAWPVKTWSAGKLPTALVENAGELLFLREEGVRSLWKSDGTEAGTLPVKQVATAETAYSPRKLTAAGGTFFFSGNDGHSGFELWSSDGSAEGTGMLLDLHGTRDGLLGVSPGGVAAWGDNYVFRGNDGETGEEPWRTDGTTAGTLLLADTRPGSEGSDPARFAAFGNTLFFEAGDGIHGREPWRSDPGGTAMIRDINPGNASSYLREFVPLASQIAFTANDQAGSALWTTDGYQTNRGKEGAGVQMAPFTGGLLFTATDATHGEEPWWTDGTTNRLVKDLRPGSLGSGPAWFTVTGSHAYFQAHDVSGFGLWRTDGTEEGTGLVNGWTGPGSVHPLVAAGNRLFFFESDGTTGLRLWIAQNGQATFVRRIGETGKTYAFDYPAEPYMAACGDILFFKADDGVHGEELWRSDGTPAGTVMVRDIRPGAMGSAPVNLKNVGGMVFFQANDGVSGEELWATNGTESGTRLAADIAAGSGGSAPGDLVLAGQRLFFSAVTNETGREPYVFDVGETLDYHAWTKAAGLAGLDTLANAAPRGDGVANLLKYAFGIDGDVSYQGPPAGEPGHLPSFSITTGEEGKLLTVKYARRTESSLKYTVMRSATLAENSFMPMNGTEIVELIGGGWERVVRSEQVDGGKCFGRVEVTLPLE